MYAIRSYYEYGIKVKIRELFARVKLMIDLFLINKQPKFLGEKIFRLSCAKLLLREF